MAKIIGYRRSVGPRMQLVGFGADTSTTTVDASTVAPSAPVKGLPGIPGLTTPLFSDADIQHYAAVAVDVAWPAIETKLDAKIDEYKKPLYVAAAVSAAAYVFLLSLIMRRR